MKPLHEVFKEILEYSKIGLDPNVESFTLSDEGELSGVVTRNGARYRLSLKKETIRSTGFLNQTFTAYFVTIHTPFHPGYLSLKAVNTLATSINFNGGFKFILAEGTDSIYLGVEVITNYESICDDVYNQLMNLVVISCSLKEKDESISKWIQDLANQLSTSDEAS